MKKTLLMLALMAGITSFAQNAQAELITINIGSTGFNIYGLGGGLDDGDLRTILGFPISPNNTLEIYNNYVGEITGLAGYPDITFAAGNTVATPVKFSLNALIDSRSSYDAS